jgi:hypothetical protein
MNNRTRNLILLGIPISGESRGDWKTVVASVITTIGLIVAVVTLVSLCSGCSSAQTPSERCTPLAQRAYLKACEKTIELECNRENGLCLDPLSCIDALKLLCPTEPMCPNEGIGQ